MNNNVPQILPVVNGVKKSIPNYLIPINTREIAKNQIEFKLKQIKYDRNEMDKDLNIGKPNLPKLLIPISIRNNSNKNIENNDNNKYVEHSEYDELEKILPLKVDEDYVEEEDNKDGTNLYGKYEVNENNFNCVCANQDKSFFYSTYLIDPQDRNNEFKFNDKYAYINGANETNSKEQNAYINGGIAYNIFP